MSPRTDEHKVDWRNARPADPAPVVNDKRMERVLDGILSGLPLSMARASYACSRVHGLSRWEAFRGAVEIYFDYRARLRSKWGHWLSNAAIGVACAIALAILYARSQGLLP